MSDGDKPVPPEKDPGAVSPLKVVGVALASAAIGALVVKTAVALKAPVKSEIGELASYLVEQLGLDVTAYLAGVEKSPGMVGRWISGEADPDQVMVERFRFACEVVRSIVEVYDGETANAWLFGMNDWLDDEAPIHLLRTGDRDEVWTPVVEAAQGFAEY